MQRSFPRWIIALVGLVLLSLLFYGLRSEPPKPQQPRLTAVDAPAAQPKSPARLPAGMAPGDVTPKAAAQAPAVPNFVDLVQATSPNGSGQSMGKRSAALRQGTGPSAAH